MSMTQTQQHNVPSLRFPEFSGEWSIARVGSLATKIGSGVTPKGGSDVYQDSGIPLLRSQNVRNNNLYLADVAFISEEINAKMKGSAVKPHDVLLNITGASIGRSCVVPSDIGTANVNQHVCIIRLDSNSSPSFLQSFLASHRGQKLIFQSQSGSGREGLNFENIKAFKTAFPALPEQQKIASFLSSVDGKIEQLGKKKALLEQYKKGMMQKLFSQKLRFKDAQGNDFPDWEEKRLGHVANIVGGGTPETGKLEYWGGSVQWFTPTEIKQKYLSASKRTLTEEGLKKSSAKKLPIGTLLLSTRATVGDVSIAKNECTTNQGFQSLVVKDGNFNEFWYYWILMNKKELLRRASGSTFLEISKSEIAKIPALKPFVEEQQKIADFLSSIDRKIDLVSTELDHAKTFKKGLLQQMFI